MTHLVQLYPNKGGRFQSNLDLFYIVYTPIFSGEVKMTVDCVFLTFACQCYANEGWDLSLYPLVLFSAHNW